MPKRAATNELNHNNWNEEEEPEEECNTPQIASPEVLSKRIIKTGKRRITGSSGSSPATSKPAFSNFAGFGTMKSSGNDVKSPFSFLSSSNNSTFSNANGISTQKTDNDGKDDKQNGNKNINRNNEFLSKLKALNESVLEWIKIHVSKNPTCILTPIFSDYEKYLKELQLEKESKEEKDEKSESTSSTPSSGINITSTKPFFSNSLFSCGSNETAKDVTAKVEQSEKVNESSATLSAGISPLANPLLPKNDKTSSIFTLPASSSGSLADIKPPIFSNSGFTSSFFTPPTTTSTNQQEDTEKEDEEPPKNEFERVTEKDAVFSQRVKLFLKKKDTFVDNGVGTFYIKPVDEQCSKYQAIVRADTNLGNILLNIILNDSVPSKRVGKNNVMLVCLLEVDKSLKSVPTLLRVKTEADADNLLEIINKYKKP
ncbi:hypothetical protein O3M35_006824 [Rhynocoris fuscipes]|uniref:Nuclear pore complex protein Nup50 n=1 Tax=Rhynocoris fuscipes TaxID=488301 RepID=A0AAW1DHJ5_9HEMI